MSCIDSDSKESRRRITGSYYTPREIVDYMVNESLDAYLENNDDLLQCKILDPACGSGAFPCGVMNNIMYRLDPDKQFSQQERYRTKLKIIRDVIYGVDIQPMAVQITLLRFFLSLIQEIDPDKRKANYGIDPLPNLEMKFVCVDALIGLKNGNGNGQRSLELPIIRETIKQLQETRSRYFMATNVHDKKFLRQNDESLRKMLGIALQDAGALSHDTAEKLVTWNPYNQSYSSSFFEPIWMFGVEKFDIVIGNPPYVQLQKSGSVLAKKYEKSGYETFARTGDIYALFYERGWQLIKEGGHLCYITSNKWMRAGYGEPLRKFLCEKTNPKLLLDFAGTKVFESATVDVNILLFAKETNGGQTFTRIIHDVEELKNPSRAEKPKSLVFGSQSFSAQSSWVITSPIELRIKEKIESIGVPLKDWNIKINFGIKTGYNEAFMINGAKRADFIAADPKSEEIIKPLLRGRDIKRYGYEFADLWLINTHNGIKEKEIKPVNIDDYPVIKKHLDYYYTQLEKRTDKGDTPYNLRPCAYLDDFAKPKLLYSEIVLEPQFYLDQDGKFFPEATVFILTGEHLHFLYAVFHSKAVTYFFKTFYAGGGLGKTGYRYKKQFMETLPIPVPHAVTEKKIEQLLQAQDYPAIDALVCELYGLTDEEMAIVEQIR